MSAEVYDLSRKRTVLGATGTPFVCRKRTNEVTADCREAERHSSEVARRVAAQQKRFEKTETDADGDEVATVTNAERWEPLEREVCEAIISTLIPVLEHEDGTKPELDRLTREFGINDVQWVIEHARRPTVPTWAIDSPVIA